MRNHRHSPAIHNEVDLTLILSGGGGGGGGRGFTINPRGSSIMTL
jgi:hypothetical protein